MGGLAGFTTQRRAAALQARWRQAFRQSRSTGTATPTVPPKPFAGLGARAFLTLVRDMEKTLGRCLSDVPSSVHRAVAVKTAKTARACHAVHTVGRANRAEPGRVLHVIPRKTETFVAVLLEGPQKDGCRVHPQCSRELSCHASTTRTTDFAFICRLISARPSPP